MRVGKTKHAGGTRAVSAAAKSAADAQPASASVEAAANAGLRYVSDAAPGLRRRKAGKGFVYFDGNGRRVRDAATLARIRALAIPPAYLDVWICKDARGHLQATGRDARGRKQYRYHSFGGRLAMPANSIG